MKFIQVTTRAHHHLSHLPDLGLFWQQILPSVTKNKLENVGFIFMNLHAFGFVKRERKTAAQQNALALTTLYFGKGIYLCIPI